MHMNQGMNGMSGGGQPMNAPIGGVMVGPGGQQMMNDGRAQAYHQMVN